MNISDIIYAPMGWISNSRMRALFPRLECVRMNRSRPSAIYSGQGSAAGPGRCLQLFDLLIEAEKSISAAVFKELEFAILPERDWDGRNKPGMR